MTRDRLLDKEIPKERKRERERKSYNSKVFRYLRRKKAAAVSSVVMALNTKFSSLERKQKSEYARRT